MSRLVNWLDRTLYRDHGPNWDDELFRARILEHLAPDARVLDLGAGAGLVQQMNFRGRAAHVCGLDPDHRVLDNPHLDEARVGTGEAIPYEDGSFDVIFADNVLEHLADPLPVFREAARALNPGGVFLAKTPNRRHYVPLIARATPHRFHALVNRRRGRRDSDTFRTFYRANTPGTVRRLAERAGLEILQIALVEGRPEYLRTSAAAYLCGAAYERLVNATPLLAPFRVVLIAVLRKPDAMAVRREVCVANDGRMRFATRPNETRLTDDFGKSSYGPTHVPAGSP